MQLPSNNEYIVIGDVHGCIDELKALLKKQGFPLNEEGLLQITPKNEHKSIVLLGDFIDKASEEKLTETIEFIHKNYAHLNKERERFYLIEGNHENMVYRYLTNDSTIIVTPKAIKNKEKYYNTVALLEKDAHLKKLFMELYAACHPYLYYEYDENFSVTLTHAPCPEQYLRKESKEAKKKMIKCASRSKNPTMPLDELLPYTHEEAKENQHYHIFGHLSQPNIRQYKNKICIDTSAIYGATLSCAIIKKNQLSFDAVPFEHKQKKGKQSYNLLFDF
jgi:predicted phosphodiesterase